MNHKISFLGNMISLYFYYYIDHVIYNKVESGTSVRLTNVLAELFILILLLIIYESVMKTFVWIEYLMTYGIFNKVSIMQIL